MRVDDKVALITGAAGIIGADTARVLAEAGATVVLTDIAADRLEQTVAVLQADGLAVSGHVSDITNEDSVRRLVEEVMSEHGRIDVLDNNAGATGMTQQDRDVMSMDVDFFRRSTAINLVGPLLLCKHALPIMLAQGAGGIINISSGQSLSGDLLNTAYSAGKAGLNSLTRDIATQYGPGGIRCNAVAPGLIVAEEAEAAFPEAVRAMFVENCPVPRLGRPRDISNAVLFLASEFSSYVNGQVISVDGGILAHLPTVAPMRAAAAGPYSTKTAR